MDKQAVAQLQLLPFRQLHQVLASLHGREAGFLPAERVGGHQAIAAAVPAGALGIPGIIEDRQAHDLAVKRSGIIAPRGELSPAILLANLAVGVLQLAVALYLA